MTSYKKMSMHKKGQYLSWVAFCLLLVCLFINGILCSKTCTIENPLTVGLSKVSIKSTGKGGGIGISDLVL